jgi:Signal transduction histidine kinase
VFEKHIELSEQNQTVYGDPFRLKQILLNLLNNAVKFTNAGSISLKINAAYAGKTAHYTFEVKDTGIGISQTDQDRIFNEFEQAPTEQLSQGSGLGLSIVKALVELQGGNIKVNSIQNAGATFSVLIPYSLNDSGQSMAGNSLDALAKAPPRLVWVIDDDSFILELCAEVLKKYNIDYKLFYSAKDLLEEPVPEELSHVLMDIRMPEYSGMELVKMMKVKVQHAQEVQFIALTAQVLPEEVGDIFAAGFDALVRKPFVVEELLLTLGITLQDPVLEPERPPIVEGDHIMDLFKKENPGQTLT